VPDASVAACWTFDEKTILSLRWRLSARSRLWWFEVRNTLIASERRGRLTESYTAAFLHGLRVFGSRLICRRTRLTFLRSPATATLRSTRRIS
jgi:hypothetical protein